MCRAGFRPVVEEVSAATRRKNAALAVALVGFVGGVYQYTYAKMKTVRRACAPPEAPPRVRTAG